MWDCVLSEEGGVFILVQFVEACHLFYLIIALKRKKMDTKHVLKEKRQTF